MSGDLRRDCLLGAAGQVVTKERKEIGEVNVDYETIS